MSDLFSNMLTNKRSLSIPDAEIDLFDSFLDDSQASKLFLALKNNIDWRQDEIQIFGKKHLLPRLTAWYGSKSYTYSGIQMKPESFTKELLLIKESLEKLTELSFNSCLLNYYRNGTDSMGWHQDNEKELGENPVIASISLGQERPFQMKHINNKNLKKIDIPLTHGSLLIMKGSTQHFWKHKIPKTMKPIGERINITFRKIY